LKNARRTDSQVYITSLPPPLRFSYLRFTVSFSPLWTRCGQNSGLPAWVCMGGATLPSAEGRKNSTGRILTLCVHALRICAPPHTRATFENWTPTARKLDCRTRTLLRITPATLYGAASLILQTCGYLLLPHRYTPVLSSMSGTGRRAFRPRRRNMDLQDVAPLGVDMPDQFAHTSPRLTRLPFRIASAMTTPVAFAFCALAKTPPPGPAPHAYIWFELSTGSFSLPLHLRRLVCSGTRWRAAGRM